MDNPLFKEAIGKIFRYGIFAAGTLLVRAGIWSESDLNEYANATVLLIVGSLGVVGPLIWSWMLSKFKRKKLLVALATPNSTTEQQVEATVATGRVPELSTPKTVVPSV